MISYKKNNVKDSRNAKSLRKRWNRHHLDLVFSMTALLLSTQHFFKGIGGQCLLKEH